MTIIALALAGCAQAPTPVRPSASVSAAATDVPVAAATPTKPEQARGGDCSALLTDTAASALLEAEVSLRAGFVDSPGLNAVPSLGGLECSWVESVLSTHASLSTVVVSSAVVDADPDSVLCYGVGNDPSGGLSSACAFSVVSGPLWLSGIVQSAVGEDETSTRSVVAALSESFRALPAAGAVDAGLPATAWPSVDCDDLDSNAKVGTVLDNSDLVVTKSDNLAGELAEGVYATATSAGVFGCGWYQFGDDPTVAPFGLNIVGLPGGAWAQEQVLSLPGATIVDLAGVDLAVRVPVDQGTPAAADILDVFDGVNWLQVNGFDDMDAIAPAVVALVQTLNG